MFVNPACWHKQNYAYLTLPTKQQNSQTLVTTAIRERKNVEVCNLVCLFHTIKHRQKLPTKPNSAILAEQLI